MVDVGSGVGAGGKELVGGGAAGGRVEEARERCGMAELWFRRAGSVDVRGRLLGNVPFASPKSTSCVLPYGCVTRVELDDTVEEIDG